jgi:hypothetical protein
MIGFSNFLTRLLLLCAVSGVAAGGAVAGPALDRMDGRWSGTHCGDPNLGTWTVIGDQIQFHWPLNQEQRVLERVLREESDMIETEVVFPDSMRGTRYRYYVQADRVLIETVRTGSKVVVRRCS